MNLIHTCVNILVFFSVFVFIFLSLVWERNTVWKDLIEQERRTTSIGLRKRTGGSNRLRTSSVQFESLISEGGDIETINAELCKKDLEL